MRTFNTGKITFEYPNGWEVEKADTEPTVSVERADTFEVIVWSRTLP